MLGCSLLALACSGEGARKCEFATCGGDPTGSWYGEWICPDKGFTAGIGGVDDEPQCEDAVGVTDVAFDLALRLDPYHQFVYNGTILVYWEMTWTPECVNALNGHRYTPEQLTEVCANYSQTLTNDPTSTFQSGKCVMDTTGTCHCDATQSGPIDERGGYYVAGDKIYFDSGYTLDFCRRGNELAVRDERTTLGPIVERLRELSTVQ
jgi:hypothetical protein